MTAIHVQAASVSEAWRQAVQELFDCPDRRSIHTVVRIEDPLAKPDTTWLQLDEWLGTHEHYSIDTVANTIFPATIAATSRDHGHLVQRYRNMYERLCRTLPANRRGTYFGRLVAYPVGPEQVDQLGTVIDHIRSERLGGRPKYARYEAALQVPDDMARVAATVATTVYAPGRDNSIVGFPCLSHCSFQIDR